LYQKHFDLGKTLRATPTTDCVTSNATVDVWNCKDYVAHDWHRLVKLAIFIQRCCAFFVQRKPWFFTGEKFSLLGLWPL